MRAPVTAQSTRQSMENLIYVAGEIDGSDSIIYRLGGLADPTTVQLNDDFEDSEGQAVAVSGNNVFVVWDSDSSEILYRRSIDGGATYSDIVILSDDSIDTNSRNPSISVVGSNVFVVWSDSGQILLRKSIDNGVSLVRRLSQYFNSCDTGNSQCRYDRSGQCCLRSLVREYNRGRERK